jgi:hypothetical protein
MPRGFGSPQQLHTRKARNAFQDANEFLHRAAMAMIKGDCVTAFDELKLAEKSRSVALSQMLDSDLSAASRHRLQQGLDRFLNVENRFVKRCLRK